MKDEYCLFEEVIESIESIKAGISSIKSQLRQEQMILKEKEHSFKKGIMTRGYGEALIINYSKLYKMLGKERG